MKIIIKNKDETRKVIIEIPDDSKPYDVIENVCNILIGYGFQLINIEDAIIEMAEMIKDTDKKTKKRRLK